MRELEQRLSSRDVAEYQAFYRIEADRVSGAAARGIREYDDPEEHADALERMFRRVGTYKGNPRRPAPASKPKRT